MAALTSRTKARTRRRRRAWSAHPGSSSSATTTMVRHPCDCGNARKVARKGRPFTAKRAPSSRWFGETWPRPGSRRARAISSGTLTGTNRREVSGSSARESAGDRRDTRRPFSSARTTRLGRARSCSSRMIRSTVSVRSPSRRTPTKRPDRSRRARSAVTTTRRSRSGRRASASTKLRSLHTVFPLSYWDLEAVVTKAEQPPIRAPLERASRREARAGQAGMVEGGGEKCFLHGLWVLGVAEPELHLPLEGIHEALRHAEVGLDPFHDQDAGGAPQLLRGREHRLLGAAEKPVKERAQELRPGRRWRRRRSGPGSAGIASREAPPGL